MTNATVRQIQHNFAAVLRKIEAGEEVEIRRRNRPVARLVPIGAETSRSADWSGLRAWRARLFPRGKIRGKSASELIGEARGDR